MEETDENPFDLLTHVQTEGFLVGFAGVAKVITEDGTLRAEFVAHEMNNYETIGMLTVVLDDLRAEYAAIWSAGEEDAEEE